MGRRQSKWLSITDLTSCCWTSACRAGTATSIVLVALTGYGQETDREASHQAGFDYHLVKPTNFDDVSRILATVSLGTEEKRSADEKALD